MGSLDDLPQRGVTHETAEAAERAFANAVADALLFVHQGCDRHDYGSDAVIEAVREGAVTNLRIHAQLKGTTATANSDGSVSVSVARTTLNYLLNQPSSLFVCYHVPSGRLLARYAEDVYAEYAHRDEDWLAQDSITVRFHASFDREFQHLLHRRLLAAGEGHRETRLDWIASPPGYAAELVRQTPRIIDVPADPDRAQLILAALYEAGEDDVISASFAAFAAVLDGVEGALDAAYMAEINRGLNHAAFDKQRVRRGIEVLRTAATSRRIEPLSAGYCEANARLALGEHALAIEGYSGILPQLEQLNAHIAAMCAKNLGSAYEALGDVSSAHQFYARAVELDSELGEAHFALAMCARRDGDIQMALSHLDRVAPSPRSAIRMPSVSGWRIALLFQTGDYNAAFRDISTLRDQARSARWIWPWCARQVAIYGRATVDSTKLALRFWNGYLEEHPDVAPAKRERLLCLARLDRHSVATRVSFDAFVAEVSEVAAAGDSQAALLWDVAGHWAQREGRWDDAEAAFRRAHELDSSRFAYCLATALNFLDRYDEALRVLNALPLVDMDAQAWFQLAVARDGIGNLEGAIAAYRLAIGLEPAYALAWFNLGGVLFNAGDLVSAREIWTDALNRFPEHELAATIRNEFAFVVGDGH